MPAVKVLLASNAEVIIMATLTIRDLDDQVKAGLRVRAAHNGRSMEAEARVILADAVARGPRSGLGTRIRERFGESGSSLDIPPRTDLGRETPGLTGRLGSDE